jgi:hypothetical protein
VRRLRGYRYRLLPLFIPTWGCPMRQWKDVKLTLESCNSVNLP